MKISVDAKRALFTTIACLISKIIIRDTSAIGYDLQYKVQESFRKFNYELKNQLKELLENLRTKIDYTIASNKYEIDFLAVEKKQSFDIEEKKIII